MELITRNPDLKRLFDEGYEVQITNGHVVLHSVPYLTAQKELAYGILVAALELSGDDTAYGPASDHTVYFAGSHPCGVDGIELRSIKNGSERKEVLPGLWVHHRFSAKPSNNYRDHHHKMTTYVKKLRAPLLELGISADARTYSGVTTGTDNSPFHFQDTNSARAGMSAINNRVAGQKIAIIGVGGTGSYVLDFIAKMPVAEIHIFDGDVMLSHNAFRAPGSPTVQQLREMINKAEYHAQTYSRMHRGVHAYPYNMDGSKLQELEGVDFVFLSMDGGDQKQEIVRYLQDHNKAFVDVGLNMRVADGMLRGQVRTTLLTPVTAAALAPYMPRPSERVNDDVYESNAQIAELNALNACLAIIAWKRHNGIYDSLGRPDHLIFKLRNGAFLPLRPEGGNEN